MSFELLLLLPVFAVTAAGIAAFIRLSRGKGFLAIPNERSLHAEPVPVGAGLVISTTVLAALILFVLFRNTSLGAGQALFAAYLIGSAVLIAVSWADDLRQVPAFVRFGVHSLAAMAILWFSPVWEMDSGSRQSLFAVATFIWIVGFTNAFNFMDGIDGIAGSQAIAAGLGWGILGAVLGAELVSLAGFAVAAACAAFLFFNWEPAKVFMGDSGSAFLGFSFAVFPIFTLSDLYPGDALTPGRWVIVFYAVALTWPFVFDSSVTFVRRLLNGERVWEPHRRHLYQTMVMRGMAHSSIAALYGLSGIICSAAVIVSALYRTLYPAIAAVVIISLVLPVAAHFSKSEAKRQSVGKISEAKRH